MKKKITKYIVIGLVVIALIGAATWLSMPYETYHIYLHENYFEYEAYREDNSPVDLPFEVMLTGIKKVARHDTDSVYCFSLLMQPRANHDPRRIVAFDIEPLQTETYNHYNFFIEQFAYNEQERRMQVFLTVEKRRYQMVLSKLDR